MLSLKIALRYLLSKKSHSAVNVISAISVAGVAVAVAAIVVVLSVFNGFSSLARAQFSHIDPDLLITPSQGKVICAGDSLAAAVAALGGVDAATPVLSERGLLVAGDSQFGVVFTGAGEDYGRVVDLDAIVADGEVLDTLPTSLNPTGVASPAALAVGILARIKGIPEMMQLYVPRRLGRINPANPAGAFEQTDLVVTAMLQSDRMEFDGDHIIIPLAAARRLLGYYGTEASAVAVAVGKDADPAVVARGISAAIGPRYSVATRDMQQAESFRMIAIEKWVTFMMLVFILVIAAFNIVSTLSLMVIEKRDNMATLRFMGATRAMIRRIFMIQGALITMAGAVIGIVIGLALSLAQQYGGFIRLNGDPSKMTISVYPVEVQWGDILAVMAMTAVIAFLTSQITRIFTRKIE